MVLEGCSAYHRHVEGNNKVGGFESQQQHRCFYEIYIVSFVVVDQVSSVGIATRCGLHGPGIESRCGRDLPRPSWPALYNGYRVKWPQGCVDHPPLSSAEVTGSNFVPLAPLWAFMASFRVNLGYVAVLYVAAARSESLYRQHSRNDTNKSKVYPEEVKSRLYRQCALLFLPQYFATHLLSKTLLNVKVFRAVNGPVT